MPTYEYLCSDCGNSWEEMQKISADPTKECPKCHHETAKRQINGGNFILKGGGWYADLYSSAKPGSSSGGGSSGGSSSSGSSSSESKSETKSESTAAPAAAPAASSGSSSSGSSGGSSSST